MRNFINAIVYMLIGTMLLIQQDPDGGLVINNWKGIGAVCIVAFIMCIAHVILIIIGQDDSEDEDEIDWNAGYRAATQDYQRNQLLVEESLGWNAKLQDQVQSDFIQRYRDATKGCKPTFPC